MSAATRALPLLALIAVVGCGGEAEQNMMIANEVPADAEIEVLPPDESVTTPSDELENGTADPNVNGAG